MVRKINDEPVITKLSGKLDESFIPSGIPELDELIGGIPRARILELWGSEGIGKTGLVTQLMVNLSKDYKILFVDSEFALNKAYVASKGVNMENVDYIADSQLERVCEMIIDSIGKYDLIILDSLAYLTPLTIDTNQVGENTIGIFARLIKHWVVKFRPRLGVSQTAFIAVNQYRAPIGNYIKPEAPGGKAWAHAVDVRLFLTSNSADKVEKKGERIGQWLHVRTVKSKVSIPHKTTKIKILY